MKKPRLFASSLAARIAGALAAAAVVLIGGCSSGSYQTVPPSVANQAQSAASGTVLATRTVVIDGSSSQLGIYGGAVMGSAVGQTMGSGSGRIVAAGVGSVAGAAVGSMVEKEMTKKVAQELTIGLDDGHTVVVVQELKQPEFIEGDRVTMTETRSGTAYVTHAHYQSDGVY